MLDKNMFWFKIDFISYMWCIHAFYHINMNNFVNATFSKSIILKVKNMFEPNEFKSIIKIIVISSSPFALLIINVKILFNFQKE